MPKVSVIVPNYNHAPYLKKRLDSVFNQTFRDFEVIVLDDCSTDESRSVIESYRDQPTLREVIYNDRNSGAVFSQWEKGLKAVSGSYIWIAESDDWAEETFLETAVNSLDLDSQANIFFCQSRIVDADGAVSGNIMDWYADVDPDQWRRDQIFEGDEFVIRYMTQKNVVPNASAVLFKKEPGLKYIQDIKKFKLCGDWLYWSLLAKNAEICYSASFLNNFRYLAQATRNHSTMKKVRLRIKEEFWLLERFAEEFDIPRQVISKRRISLAEKWVKAHSPRNFFKRDFYVVPSAVHPILIKEMLLHTIDRLGIKMNKILRKVFDNHNDRY